MILGHKVTKIIQKCNDCYFFVSSVPKPTCGGFLRGFTSRQGAGGGMKIPLPAAQKFRVCYILWFKNRRQGCCRQIPVSFAPPARALGAAPAPLVLLRCSGSHLRRLPSHASEPPAVSPRSPRNPSVSSAASEICASRGPYSGRACFPSQLRQPCGLPSRFRKPLRVLLHGSTSLRFSGPKPRAASCLVPHDPLGIKGQTTKSITLQTPG